MLRDTTSGRTVGTLMAGLVVSAASMAGAAVDMTATWRIQATVGPITIVTYETVVQTVTELAMSRPVDPPVAIPGTIDPDTGVFQLSFGPAMQSGVEEPGSEVIRQGTVAPQGPPSDELRLSGISIKARDPVSPVSKLSVTGDTTGPLGVPTALRLRLAVKRPSLVPPFVAPVGFTIGLADGVHIGEISTCKTNSKGSIRCKR